MGLADKFRHTAEKIGGKGKAGTGHTMRDDALKAQGKNAQAKANMKDVGEKLKGALKKKH
jgi:uncharacterized protein YjbJ (UPF0337 family)